MDDHYRKKTLAIVVGGGPAPGINGVIRSVTIEAINSGMNVLGILDGFEHLSKGDSTHYRELKIEDVSRIHFSGGKHTSDLKGSILLKARKCLMHH
ncbi:MAG: 6-phosphofructokinase [Ignavibacteria bacterium]